MTVINNKDFPPVSGLYPWSAQIGSSTYEAPAINGGHGVLYGICYDITTPTTGNLSFYTKEITSESGSTVPLQGFQGAAILAGPVPQATGQTFPQILQWIYRTKANTGWTYQTFNLGSVFGQQPVTLFFGVESPGSSSSLEQLVAGVAVQQRSGTISAPVPGPHIVSTTLASAGSAPAWITSGPDGNIWFTEATGSAIGRVTPATSVLAEFGTPTMNASPAGIAAGSDGNVWFIERVSGGQMGRISTNGAITEFALPVPSGLEQYPTLLFDRGDGNMWYGEGTYGGNPSFGGTLAFRNETTGATGSVPLPTAIEPFGVAAGQDGNLYVTDSGQNERYQVSPTSGTLQFVNLPPAAGAAQIILGPDGNLWFTNPSGSTIGRLSPGSLTVTQFPTVTPNAAPQGITVGADGNLWFTEANSAHIGRITPSGAVTEFPIPNAAYAIATAPDGSMWYTQQSPAAVLKFVL